MQKLTSDCAVCCDEIKSCCHVWVNHTRAFSHSANGAFHTVNVKFNGVFLFYGVRCHNSGCRFKMLVVAKTLCKYRNSLFNRFNRQNLADNAGACNNNLLLRNVKLVCNKLAHSVCFFNAVCVAGVCVFRVCNNGDCLVAALFKVCLRNDNRRTLYLVLRINSRRVANNIACVKANVVFMLD